MAHPCHLLTLFFVAGACALIGSTFALTWTSTNLGSFVTINAKLFQECSEVVSGTGACNSWDTFLNDAAGKLFCTSPGDPSAHDLKIRVQLVQGFVICAIICAVAYFVFIILHSFKLTTARWHWVIANICSLCFGLAALITWATFVYQCDTSFCDMAIVSTTNSGGSSSNNNDNPPNLQWAFCTPGAGTWLAVVAGGILLCSLFPMLIFARPGTVTSVAQPQAVYQPFITGATTTAYVQPATVQAAVVQVENQPLPEYYAPVEKQGY